MSYHRIYPYGHLTFLYFQPNPSSFVSVSYVTPLILRYPFLVVVLVLRELRIREGLFPRNVGSTASATNSSGRFLHSGVFYLVVLFHIFCHNQHLSGLSWELAVLCRRLQCVVLRFEIQFQFKCLFESHSNSKRLLVAGLYLYVKVHQWSGNENDFMIIQVFIKCFLIYVTDFFLFFVLFFLFLCQRRYLFFLQLIISVACSYRLEQNFFMESSPH